MPYSGMSGRLTSLLTLRKVGNGTRPRQARLLRPAYIPSNLAKGWKRQELVVAVSNPSPLTSLLTLRKVGNRLLRRAQDRPHPLTSLLTLRKVGNAGLAGRMGMTVGLTSLLTLRKVGNETGTTRVLTALEAYIPSNLAKGWKLSLSRNDSPRIRASYIPSNLAKGWKRLSTCQRPVPACGHLHPF